MRSGPTVIKEREGAREREGWLREREREEGERESLVFHLCSNLSNPEDPAMGSMPSLMKSLQFLTMITVGTLILVELQNLMDLWVVRLGDVREEPILGQGQGHP